MGAMETAVGITLPRAGAAYANGLAVRYGHSEGSGRDHAALHWGLPMQMSSQ